MRVLFDHQIFTLQRHGGVSRYYVRLAEALHALGHSPSILAPLHRNAYLQAAPAVLVRGIGVPQFPRGTVRLCKEVSQALAAMAVHRLPYDLLHETYYTDRPIGRRATPRVVTVFDMIHERYPNDFPRRDTTSALKRIALARADHILAISQSTKNDVCAMFGIASQKVTVVHLGCDPRLPEIGDSLSHVVAMPPNRPYLLYVGQRAGYKNFAAVLHALAGSPALQRAVDVVAFGGPPWTAADREQQKRFGFSSGQVRHCAGDDTVLASLYRHARALIYPSLYEGFGLPPLEAMQHDCPVIASQTSSMPEVIGAAAEYFDPCDPADLARAIEVILHQPERVLALRALGRRRAAEFTWHRCAQQTLAVYQRVAGQAPDPQR